MARKRHVQGHVCAHCVMAGILPCFLDASSPSQWHSTIHTNAQLREQIACAHTSGASARVPQDAARGSRALDSCSRPSSSSSSSSKPATSQHSNNNSISKPAASAEGQLGPKILASPLSKLPHKYKRVTIRHTMGTTQEHVL